MVHEKVRLAVSKIKVNAASTTADLLKWWILMATDVTVHLAFGESFHMTEKGEVKCIPVSGLHKQLTRISNSSAITSTRSKGA